MADLLRQWVWTSLFLSIHLILFYNSIKWTALADQMDLNLTKCGSASLLCRYKYPLDPDGQVLDNQPSWNTTAVDSTSVLIRIPDCKSFLNKLRNDNYWNWIVCHRFSGCRCDAECGHYGDCCLDAAAVYSSDVTSPWTCLPMTTEADPSDQQVSPATSRSEPLLCV